MMTGITIGELASFIFLWQLGGACTILAACVIESQSTVIDMDIDSEDAMRIVVTWPAFALVLAVALLLKIISWLTGPRGD